LSAALDVAELAARAREDALGAIRLLEGRLRGEAAGCLRGLPELAPGYVGANIRAFGRKRWGMAAWLRPGRTHLCVGKDGGLQVAWLEDDGPKWRAALDADLLAEDLEPLAQVAADLLREHARRLGETAEAHGRVVALAGRLSRALRA
jgi:hypothetical protein